jgi:hypothetical protein
MDCNAILLDECWTIWTTFAMKLDYLDDYMLFDLKSVLCCSNILVFIVNIYLLLFIVENIGKILPKFRLIL